MKKIMVEEQMNYFQKKLKPLRDKEAQLTIILKETKEALKIEEDNNDLYFDEVQELEIKIQDIEKQLVKLSKSQSSQKPSDSKLDKDIEERIKKELDKFFFNRSKKSILEVANTIRGTSQNNKKKNDIIKDAEKNIILVQRGNEAISQINIPPDIVTFEDFRMIMGLYYGVNEKEVFLSDRHKNLLQLNMNIIDNLYPPVYSLLRSYQPKINVEIKRYKREKNQDFGQNQKQKEKNKSKMIVKQQLPQEINLFALKMAKLISFLKNLLEQALYFSMTIIFIQNYINGKEFYRAYTLMEYVDRNIVIQQQQSTNIIEQFNPILKNLLVDEDDPQIDPTKYPTVLLKKGRVIQQMVVERPFNECHFTSKLQKDLFVEAKETCLDYDQIDENDQGSDISEIFNPNVKGFIFDLDFESKEKFEDSWKKMTLWLKYRIKTVSFIFNSFNAPSNQLLVTMVRIFFAQPGGTLNNYMIETRILDLNHPTPEDEAVSNQIVAQAAILIFLAIIENFGIHPSKTDQKIVNCHIMYQQNLQTAQDLKGKIKFKNDEQSHQIEQMILDQQLTKKPAILNDYLISQFKDYYLVVKIPNFFEINFLLVCILVITNQRIMWNEKVNLSSIDITSEDFMDPTQLLFIKTLTKSLRAFVIIMLMFSSSRFLALWDPALLAYGTVILSFIKYAWFQMLITILLFTVVSFSWIIIVNGDLLYNFDIVFVMMRTISLSQNNQSEGKNIQKPELQILQFIILIMFNLLLYPIISALLSKFVYNTQNEIEYKKADLIATKLKEKEAKNKKITVQI